MDTAEHCGCRLHCHSASLLLDMTVPCQIRPLICAGQRPARHECAALPACAKSACAAAAWRKGFGTVPTSALRADCLCSAAVRDAGQRSGHRRRTALCAHPSDYCRHGCDAPCRSCNRDTRQTAVSRCVSKGSEIPNTPSLCSASIGNLTLGDCCMQICGWCQGSHTPSSQAEQLHPVHLDYRSARRSTPTSR
jgi:hypothetical protein